MSRPEFENQTLISAVTSKTIHYIGQTFQTDLNYGQYESVQLYSPDGTISRVIGFAAYFNPCGQVRSTEKQIMVSLIEFEDDGFNFKGIIEQLNVTGYDDRYLNIEYGQPHNHSKIDPSDLSAFQIQLKEMIFTDTKPLQVTFFNNTGYATSTKREFRIFVEREVVSR